MLNEVGVDKTFGKDVNAATVLGADGSTGQIAQTTKEELADAVWDLVVGLLR